MKRLSKTILVLFAMGLLASTLFAKNAQTLLEENACMSCHNIRGMNSAPSFMGIARMNSSWLGASKDSIMESIKDGSQGKYPMFSNTKMPGFSHLSKEELSTLTEWILEQGSRGMQRKNMHKGSRMNNGMMRQN